MAPMSAETALQARNEAHGRIMGELFDLTQKARTFEGSSLSSAAREGLTEGQIKSMRAREAEAWAQNHAAELKEEFIEVEEQYAKALRERREEILEALFGPASEASGEVMLQYASAPSEVLASALEMAVVSDNLEVIQMVSLAAYQRNLEDVENRIAVLVPETADLLGELATIDQRVEDLDDPGDYFESIAPEPPTREKILTR